MSAKRTLEQRVEDFVRDTGGRIDLLLRLWRDLVLMQQRGVTFDELSQEMDAQHRFLRQFTSLTHATIARDAARFEKTLDDMEDAIERIIVRDQRRGDASNVAPANPTQVP